MARARNLKPGLFKNEMLGTADPFLTILFEGLWCLADREGRLEDRPLRIAAEIFPYRGFTGDQINGFLTELASLNFIRRYKVDGSSIIQVCKFVKHQSPHKTEKDSELPPEPAESKQVTESTVIAPLEDERLTEQERPDSLLLTPDSPLTETRNGDGASTLSPFSKNGTPIRSHTPVNADAQADLEDWLDAIAPEIGAKSRATIADYRGWEHACQKAITEHRELSVMLEVIREERERLRDTPEFFSPTSVLKKLQTKSTKAPVRKFFH